MISTPCSLMQNSCPVEESDTIVQLSAFGPWLNLQYVARLIVSLAMGTDVHTRAELMSNV